MLLETSIALVFVLFFFFVSSILTYVGYVYTLMMMLA